ncbi:hypothetical protein ACHAXT_008381 [Thalassiosira profunda]
MLFVVLLALAGASGCASFSLRPVALSSRPDRKSLRLRRCTLPPLCAVEQDEGAAPSTKDGQTKNPLELASWYAVEAFGKAFGGKNAVAVSPTVGSIDLTKAPSSLDETLQRIQLDNDRSYFLSGEVDRLIYDEQCTFADPFVSFDGRDRFIDNLQNLGSFITAYDAKMLKYDVGEGGAKVNTKVMVKLELGLPWKPVLAWPWGVAYSIDAETNLITSHVESWDIAPWEGVKQIFRRPTVQIGKK